MALPLAVLISGNGSNLQAIIDHIEKGTLAADIRLVLSNIPGAYGLQRAASHGIPSTVIDHTQYPDREHFDQALVNAVRASGAELIVLAGFMRLFTRVFLDAFSPHIVNIHPAILPAFRGAHAQRDAAEYGVRLAGATVHFVEEIMDTGAVIIQAAVPAFADDSPESLGKRILALEHRIYPQALQWLAEDPLQVRGNHVHLVEADRPKAVLDSPALVSPFLEEGF